MTKKKELPWECMYNHFPKWVIDLENALDAIMSNSKNPDPQVKVDNARMMVLLDRFNKLTDYENKYSNEPHKLYGVDNEKEEITTEVIAIYTRYRKEAEQLMKDCGDDDYLNNKE